jgi:hypothetical protein
MTSDREQKQDAADLQDILRRSVTVLGERHAGNRLKSLKLLAERLTEHAVPAAFSTLSGGDLTDFLERMLAMVEGCGDSDGVSVVLWPLARSGRVLVHRLCVRCSLPV